MYKGTMMKDLDTTVTRSMAAAEQIERGKELAKLKKISGQFWNVHSAAVSLGYPYADIDAAFESIPEHRAILLRSTKQADRTGPAILIGYSHAERCYIYKEATLTDEGMLDRIASFDYGVYTVNDPLGTFAVADPADGEDGFYLVCNSIQELYAEMESADMLTAATDQTA